MKANHLLFETKGNIEFLSQNRLALFASRQTSSELDKISIDIFNRMRNLPLSLAGGWQASLEKKLFKLTKADDRANYIFYLNKNINTTVLSEQQELLLKEDKLLLISPGLRSERPSGSDVTKRDDLIFSQINKILFLTIRRGGLLETYFNNLLLKRYQVFLLNHPDNSYFLQADAVTAFDEDNLDIIL